MKTNSLEIIQNVTFLHDLEVQEDMIGPNFRFTINNFEQQIEKYIGSYKRISYALELKLAIVFVV